MEKTKSKVVKSKSSNSTLTKYNPMDKKSRSNATFHTHSNKKRGVYVERKPTKESVNDTAENAIPKEPVKAPKRPSRGQKRFLASVLSLLSQSSAATQCPDYGKKLRTKKANKTFKAENMALATIDPDKRKKKYKSKILNSSNYPPDTFEVLQCRKNIIQTPSIDCSDDEEIEDIKWAEFLPRLVQPDSEELQIEKDKKLSHLVKEVAEGRMVTEKRVTIEAEEPCTLVSENRKNTTKDPEFYNFFVDLLETTFSVYNVKSEYDYYGAQSPVSSRAAFEMDEAVANKLRVAQEISRQPSVHSRRKEEPKKEELADYFQLCAPRRTRSPPKKKKNKPEYIPKYRPLKLVPRQPLVSPRMTSIKLPPSVPKSASVTQNKSFYKKNSKQMLINMLKEQLRMDNQPLEEPQNLFQALKVLAKNKRKTQKTIRFEKTPDEPADCMFKTRRLLPRRSKLKSDSHKILASPQLSQYKRQQNNPYSTGDKDSNHSIEVVNIDYDRYGRSRRRKDMIATSISPTSYSPDFSPVESLFDSSYDRSYAPMVKHVVMAVKTLNHSKNRDISYERDEALI